MSYQKLISGFLSLIRLSDIILFGGLELRSDLKKINEQKRTDLVGQTERALYLMDVSEYYGLGLKPVTRMAHECGAIYKIGRKILIRRSIFEEYLREQRKF